ncbi:MAG: hypothetical protein ACOX5Q_04225 [Bacillota bacterium]|nr:hypothetical protein [Candidatus Fermentithermobacillaceae bacterium]
MAKRAPVGSGGRPPEKPIRPSSKDVEILATLLVAYPQVSRVTYDPKRKALNLVFLCKGPMSAKTRERICNVYLDSVSVYLDLIGARAAVAQCMWNKMDDFYCLIIERDIASLTPGELNLTVELLEEKTTVLYASDEGDNPVSGDDMNASARVFLQDTVNQVRNLESTRKLVALREGEKVLVFDK